jgi:hypothetical protein
MAVKSEAEFLIFLTSRKLGQIGFTEMTGGDLDRSVEEYPDAEQDESGYIAGTAKYTPIELSVPYDPKKHDAFLAGLKSFCMDEGDDIQVVAQPIRVCPDQTADGKARSYSLCVPSSIKFPSIKRGTSGVSMLRCTLNPKRMNFK